VKVSAPKRRRLGWSLSPTARIAELLAELGFTDPGRNERSTEEDERGPLMNIPSKPSRRSLPNVGGASPLASPIAIRAQNSSVP